MVLAPLAALAAAAAAGEAPSAESSRNHVCVYGATPAGVAAAVAAARGGARVTLVEPTPHFGGMLTSGLSHTDFHSFESLTGFFLEFAQRVEGYYSELYGPDSEQVQASFRGTFAEPHVNAEVLRDMVDGTPELALHLDRVLEALQLEGGLITQATFRAGGAGGAEVLEVAADVFIDATYEGDLMAAAGVSYAVGREGRDAFGEPLAPPSADHQLQAYNFRFCATDRPELRVPVQAPDGYRRERFEPVLAVLASGAVDRVFGYPKRCIFKAQTPVLPNGKYDINDVSNGPVRLSMPGANLAWPEGDATARRRVFDEHLLYNVGLLYFLQNDPAVPEKFRTEASRWGWCRDEFASTNHLPPQLYVREARRMQGEHIYTQRDSAAAEGDARARHFRDSVASGDYGNNCHGTAHEGPEIGGRHTGEFYNPVPPYQIPYGVLLPRVGESRNLLVPVAASSSHVGFCALRLEPIWCSLGQAAGHAAALAPGGDVHDADLGALQSALHRQGSATVYTSDVPPGHPDFEAVQWWGTAAGGLHGLEPPAPPRGANLHGQYYEAAPGHAVQLDRALDAATRERWLALAGRLGAKPEPLAQAATRGEFIRAAFAAAASATGSTPAASNEIR